MDLIYLDNAATSFPKPEETYVFMDQFYRSHGVNPGRSGYDLCMETGQLVDDTRALLTRFFNGTDPNRLVFAYNSTDALNLALFGLLQRGDHAITTTVEHNSVLRPLHHLAAHDGVEVDHVPFDASGFVDPDAIRARIRTNTRVVALNHASNVIGTVQPVGEIGRICREHGIRLVVDASQTAGKIPIDVQAMNIDVLCFTGHKSLMGPTGIGGMYVREGVEHPADARRRHRRALRAARAPRRVPVAHGVRDAERDGHRGPERRRQVAAAAGPGRDRRARDAPDAAAGRRPARHPRRDALLPGRPGRTTSPS